MPSTPRGITYPAGSDRVAVAADLQGMAVTVDAALAEFASVPALADGVDLNDVTASGTVISLGYESHLNVPEADSGVVQTYPLPDGGALQTWQGYNSGSVFARALSNVGNWSAWRRVSGPALAADGESSATKAVRADDSRLGAAAALPAIYESLATKAEQSEVDLKADASAVPALASDGESSSTKAVRSNDARLSDARPPKNTTMSSGDLDAVTAAGAYSVTTTTVANAPVARVGVMEVTQSGANLVQRYHETAGGSWPSVTWTRRRISGTWTAWYLASFQGPFVPPGGDFDLIRTPGAWPVQATNHPNQPAPNTGTLEVLPATGLVLQRFTTWEVAPRVFTRRATSTSAWSAWVQAPTKALVDSNTADVTSLKTRVSALEAAGSGAVPPRPLAPITPVVESKPGNDIMTNLSADRTRGWNQGGTTIRETRDDGATWTTRYTFSGQSVEMVQPLGDGELLVATTDGSSNRRVYKTSGIPGTGTVTATQVIANRVPYVKYTSAWSVSSYKNIVLIAEYGPKVPTWDGQPIAAGDNARYVFLSLDFGATWSTVFDLNAYLTGRGASLDQQHVHGVAWDPYWDRIWVSFGDAADGIVFSDDLGATWQTASWAPTSPSPTQVVGIVPLPDCVLFGGDTTPQVQRILRAPGKSGTLTLDVAYSTTGGHLMQAHHIHRGEAGTVAYLGFGAEGAAAASFVVAARSATDIVKVWQDPVDQPAGYGLRSIAGPTLRGQIVIGSNDQKVAGQWSQIKGQAPGY